VEIESETKPSVKRVGRALDPKYSEEKEGGEVTFADEEEGGEYYSDEEDGPIQPASALLADLAEKHRLRRRTLMQHSSLLELLELPSLMDACVRSSLYEDALSIAGFANTLERRHLIEGSSSSSSSSSDTKKGDKQQQPPSDNNDAILQNKKRGDVVAGVVSEIRRREADLRRMLIHRLRQDVTMPQCLEVVTALRRLNGVELERRNNSKSLSPSSTTSTSDKNGNGSSSSSSDHHDLEGVHAAMEMRLQVDFLEARDCWIEGGVTKIGSAQAAAVAANSSSSSEKGGGSSSGTSAQAEQILDGIERYRTRCFEIVTQFLAIFRGSFASTASSSTNHTDHSFSLLSMWTARRIQTFLSTLGANIITHVHDTATLRDALDAASFFASSMGRVGADFQPLLAPIFEPRLTEMIVVQWNDGLNGMMETLKACRDAGVAGPLFGTETSSGKDGNNNDGGASSGNHLDGVEMQSSRTPAPPRKLLALPPLARFLNAYLGGLNELRRCLLPGAFPAIRSAQSKLVADAKMSLQANERAVLTPGLRGEAGRLREVASKMRLEFDTCLEPYMTGCLEVALGSVDYAMEGANAAALEAEKARLAAEKVKAEKEAAERAKEEALRKAKEEEEAKARAEAEAIERAKAEAHEKEAAEKAATAAAEEAAHQEQVTDVGSSGAEEVDLSTEPANNDAFFEDEDDMYGSD